jgi:hypothetical protein
MSTAWAKFKYVVVSFIGGVVAGSICGSDAAQQWAYIHHRLALLLVLVYPSELLYPDLDFPLPRGILLQSALLNGVAYVLIAALIVLVLSRKRYRKGSVGLT